MEQEKMNLSQMYKIMQWYQNDRKEQGGHIGVFSPLPEDLSQQFPAEGKGENDTSPPHITVLYVGDLDEKKHDALIDSVKQAAKYITPFHVGLGDVDHWINHKDQKIVHCPVEGQGLHQVHEFFKKVLNMANIKYSDKYPEYKPHVTIEYIEKEEEEKFGHLSPAGEWVVDHFWIWGTKEPHYVRLGGEENF